MSANSSTPASSMASHSGIDAPNILLRPSSHRPTRQSMQTFGGGGGGGEGAMNLKDMRSWLWRSAYTVRSKSCFGGGGRKSDTLHSNPNPNKTTRAGRG